MKTIIKVTNNKGELGTLGTFECGSYGAFQILKDAFLTLQDSPYFNREVKFEHMYYKSKFDIEGYGNEFEGYTNGEDWNGWACPYFTKEVGLQIVSLLDNCTRKAWYDEAKDSFVFEEDCCDDSLEFEGEDIVVDGSVIHVYSIGACCWVWEEVENENNEEVK